MSVEIDDGVILSVWGLSDRLGLLVEKVNKHNQGSQYLDIHRSQKGLR